MTEIEYNKANSFLPTNIRIKFRCIYKIHEIVFEHRKCFIQALKSSFQSVRKFCLSVLEKGTNYLWKLGQYYEKMHYKSGSLVHLDNLPIFR